MSKATGKPASKKARRPARKEGRIKVELTPEQRALDEAIHQRSLHCRPGPDEMLASGEIAELVPNWQGYELAALMRAMRDARKARGLSLDTLAERSGIDKSMLSQLENGRRLNPTLETLYRYALAINKHIRLVLVDAEGD
jgi:DNA-binding XRE family transcriptional regulator